MPKVLISNLDHYYEETGKGQALVFIHGAFADCHIWEPQWQHFSSTYRLVRYDLRGHGRTGVSPLEHYSMTTFADDLASLLEALEIDSPIICGLSWGGSIAQAYAVRYPGRTKALILVGSMVAIDLTLKDRLLCKVMVPWWFMSLVIRSMSVPNFTRFSFSLARLTMGKHWLSHDEHAKQYLEQCMLQMDRNEYLKIWEAMYGFHILPLESITCPTLVLNGQLESKNVFRHSDEILRRVQLAEAKIIPGAQHGMTLEQPLLFNKLVEQFLLSFD
jgi:pimeloyl-ACP methyl ester carboxylesterase